MNHGGLQTALTAGLRVFSVSKIHSTFKYTTTSVLWDVITFHEPLMILSGLIQRVLWWNVNILGGHIMGLWTWSQVVGKQKNPLLGCERSHRVHRIQNFSVFRWKSALSLDELHGVMSHKTKLFITAVVTTWNWSPLCHCIPVLTQLTWSALNAE
jgi:hypothetical protein